ncbi:MAG: hypothetical protein NW216_08550 [Hyphomicrobium sp.]|nr:hypothetical protein [Hyphomicrobium sp.]
MRRRARPRQLWNGAATAAILMLAMAHAARAESDLSPLVAALSETDRTVLDKALASGPTTLVTSVGSANHALWSAFAERGWMEMGALPPGGPVGQDMMMFSLTGEGRRMIPTVLPGKAPP